MNRCMVLFLSIIVLMGCQSVPSVIDTKKTDGLAVDTIVSGKDLESTIDDIKDITDKAKDAGEIAKSDTPRLIEYVDISASQVKKLNGELLALEKSRKDDNSIAAKNISILTGERDAARKASGRRLIWAIVSTCAAALFGFILFRRLFK